MDRDITALAVAVGVMDPPPPRVMTRPAPPRWWTITKILTITIIACAIVLWIGHQADQHLGAALDAGYGR